MVNISVEPGFPTSANNACCLHHIRQGVLWHKEVSTRTACMPQTNHPHNLLSPHPVVSTHQINIVTI